MTNTTRNNGGVATGQERIHVLRLSAKDVKCIRQIAIDFDGTVHEISGDGGGQGKSTILQSIRAAIEGLEPDAIRDGTDRAELELHLTNAIINRIVHRTGDEELLVKDHDGRAIADAKHFLKTLANPSAFQPVRWAKLGEGDKRGRTERLREQKRILLEAIPLSVSGEEVAQSVRDLGEDFVDALGQVDLDDVSFDQHALLVCNALETACYDFRRHMNEKLREAQNRIELLPAPERPAPRASAEELEQKLSAVTQRYWQAKGQADNWATLRQRRDELAQRIAEEEHELVDRERLNKTRQHYEAEHDAATAKIAELEVQLKAERARRDDAASKLQQAEELERQLANHEARQADLAKMDAELAKGGSGDDLDALNNEMLDLKGKLADRQAQDQHDAAAKAAEEARQRSETFTRLVEHFRDTLPQRLLQGSDLPVQGLSVKDDMVAIDGKPLHLLGSSEQLRIAILVADALNGNAGFVTVDQAESLGRQDRQTLAQVASERKLQLILCTVNPDAQPAPNRTVMANGEAVNE